MKERKKFNQIPQFEAGVLQELETQLGKQFTLVNKVDYTTQMGFSAGNNRLTGIGLYFCGVSTLPESIGNLPSLQRLVVYSNNLMTLPESIGNLSSLETLYLNANKLTTLPEAITKLKSLQTLDLSYNFKLTTLPESIGNLKSIIFLRLSRNKLETLPESIGNLKSLKYLELRDNEIKVLPEFHSNLLERLIDATYILAQDDPEMMDATITLFSGNQTRKVIWKTMMSRKWKLIKLLGLRRSMRLLPTLIRASRI